MNILFLSLLYHPDAQDEVFALSKSGLQNQANGFQWAMIQGMQHNMEQAESLWILNALPVGIYPLHYKKLWLQQHQYSDQFLEIDSINFPYIKQKQREARIEKQLKHWIEKDTQNRMIVIYSLYLPYLRAVAAIKKKYTDIQACVIVTDLPGGLGLASGRAGILKRFEERMGKQSMELAAQMDGFILLTEAMQEPLQIQQRPICIIEGLTMESKSDSDLASINLPKSSLPIVLYTGTLNHELGIGALVEAFQTMPEYQLWLCGKGDMEDTLRKVHQSNSNIHYFGFVSQKQALYLQSKADALINPRTNQGVYTRYSFPSKTMEYMRSGKPVLCCKLDGIPDDYDPYLTYIAPQNSQGICDAVHSILHETQEKRDALGNHAKEFVLTHKNHIAQGKKAIDYLRSLLRG